MLVSLTRRLTYANVVATLALFVALGGTTVAATKIDGKTIKRSTIKGAALKNGTVTGAKLKRDTLTGRQVSERRLGKVPAAAAADTAGRADTATRAGDASTVGGRSAAQLTLTCPAGTSRYAGVCFETAARASNTWPVAAKVCGDSGGRLPSLGELEGFRQQPGITLDGTEHTAAYLDLNGITANGEATVGMSDNGGLSPGYDYGFSNASYRCVKPLTNG